jgi:hypothetical protein
LKRAQSGNVAVSIAAAIALLVVTRLLIKTSVPASGPALWFGIAMFSLPIMLSAFYIGKVLAARKWVAVRARVTSRKVAGHSNEASSMFGGSFAEEEFTYHYRFRDGSFAGSKLTLADLLRPKKFDGDGILADLRNAIAEDREVTVWVNPSNPSEAVFRPTVSPVAGLSLLVMTLIGALILLAAVVKYVV